MLDAQWARQFAQDWIAAWNRRDLAAVLDHYTEAAEFSSPYIAHFTGEPSGVLRGRDAMRQYWSRALERLPDLHFELVDVLLGADTLTLLYHGHRGLVAETLHFDGNGPRATRGSACYALPPT